MASDVPTTEPLEIQAGDTLTWSKTLTDYPASDGYTLKYRLINKDNKVDIVSTADGDDHLIEVTAAITATYPAGTYAWTSYVESTTERFTIARGTIAIKPDLAAQNSGYDIRSHAKKVLDALEAAIEGRATRTDLSYSVDGRTIQHMTHEQLTAAYMRYKGLYQTELAAESSAVGRSTRSKVKVRFTTPS